MSFSTALTTLVGVLGLANLVLALGLTRRLAEHHQRLEHLSRPAPEPLLDLGEHVAGFQTTTVDGTPLSDADLVPGTAVGFFDPECETCHEHLPAFVDIARSLGGRAKTLAVVREDPESAVMVKALTPVARVVVERRRGPVSTAFRVKATPAFCLLGPAREVVGHGMASLAEAAPESVPDSVPAPATSPA